MLSQFYAKAISALCCVCVAYFSLLSNPTYASTANSYEALLELALKNNPGLRASFHQWQGSIQLKQSAGSLPDPTVSFDYFIDEVQTRTGPQEYRVMLAQRLPWFGKRSLESDIAELMAEKALLEFETQKDQIELRFARIWSKGINLQNQVAIAHEELSLLQQIERLALIRYRHARAQHPDVVRVQLNRGQLENKLESLHYELANLSFELEDLIFASLPQDFQWPMEISSADDFKLISSITLVDQLQKNPKLKSIKLQQKIAALKTQQADLKAKPDFTLKYGRIFTDKATNPDIDGSGKDPQFIGVGINIPLWQNKNHGLSANAHENDLAAKQRIAAYQAHLTMLLKTQVSRLNTTTKQLDRYATALIPQAETALTALLKSYQTGKTNFSELLESEKTLLTLRRQQEELKASHWLATETIKTLIGENK